MRKLNLSRYPTIDNTITYFQSQYDNDPENLDMSNTLFQQVDASLNYFQNQLNDYQTLNQDILYELLLKSDAADLLNFCYLSKTTQQICQSKEFWNNKVNYSFFINDGDLQHQLQEYIALEKAEKQVFDIIEDVGYMIRIKYGRQDINTLIKLVDELFYLLRDKVTYHLDENFNILLLYEDDLKNFKKKAILLLIELFYLSVVEINQNQLNKIYQSILY